MGWYDNYMEDAARFGDREAERCRFPDNALQPGEISLAELVKIPLTDVQKAEIVEEMVAKGYDRAEAAHYVNAPYIP